MSSLFEQLKKRNVFRAAATYFALSWVLLQIVDIASPIVGLPDSIMRTLTIILAIGLVPVLVVSWLYEITSEGMKRESAVAQDSPSRDMLARKMNLVVVILLVIAIGLLVLDRFVLPDGDPQAKQLAATDSKIHSIAVLPFADFSAGGDQAYLGDGIADTILQMLAGVDGLKVAARTSSFLFRDESVDIATIGKQLSVDSVLEGSVQVSGDRIRVIAQLIRTADQTHLWSKTFDRNNEDIFAIQDEIANAVAAEFMTEHDSVGEVKASQRTSPEVYAQVLRARHLAYNRTAADIRQAIEILTRAIEEDPAYAPAHSGLATALYMDTVYGIAVLEDLKPRIETEIDKALQLDPDDPAAYAIRSTLWDWPEESEQAVADLQRSLEIDPSNVEAMLWLARRLLSIGQYQAANELSEKAYKTDPLNVQVRSDYAFYVMTELDDPDEAIAIGEETVALNLNPARSLRTLAELYMVSGRLGGVAKSYFRAAKMDPESPRSYMQMATWLSFLGERELSDQWFRVAVELRPDMAQTEQWMFRASRGESDQLMQELEEKRLKTPESLEANLDVIDAAARMGNCQRAIELGELVLSLPDAGYLETNAFAGMGYNLNLSLCHRMLGNAEEAEYFAQRYYPLVQEWQAAASDSEFFKLFSNIFVGLVAEDFDMVADSLENLPLAKPLNYGHLKHNALYQPALQNERVKSWFDGIGVQIAMARNDILEIEDPAFRDPSLLRSGG